MYDVLAYLYILSRTQKCIHVAPPRWSTGVKHFVLLLEQGWKGALVGPASPNVTRVAEQRIVLNFVKCKVGKCSPGARLLISVGCECIFGEIPVREV